MWNLVLQTLLPIILTPNHPHAPDAHAVLSDAHAVASAAPAPTASAGDRLDHNEKTIAVLTRSLDLINRATALSGHTLSPTGLLVAQQLAGLLAEKK